MTPKILTRSTSSVWSFRNLPGVNECSRSMMSLPVASFSKSRTSHRMATVQRRSNRLTSLSTAEDGSSSNSDLPDEVIHNQKERDRQSTVLSDTDTSTVRHTHTQHKPRARCQGRMQSAGIGFDSEMFHRGRTHHTQLSSVQISPSGRAKFTPPGWSMNVAWPAVC